MVEDKPKGKPCSDCGSPLVNLYGSGGGRICSGCKREFDWKLDKNQRPLIGSNRMSIDKVLNERGSRYGEFEDVSTVSQDLQHVLFCAADQKLADDQREAIQMICSKLARIVCGDHNYADSWTDIAGYATLVEKRLLGSQDEWPSDERYGRKEYRDLEKPETWKVGDIVKVSGTHGELTGVILKIEGNWFTMLTEDSGYTFKASQAQSVEARS